MTVFKKNLFKKAGVALINAVLIVCVVFGLEFYFRSKYPCDPRDNRSPWIFIPGVGTAYKPHDTVRSTNKFDY